MFAPIGFENLGVPSTSTRQLLSDLGQRLTDISGESNDNQLPVSEMLSLGIVLQCSSFARQFARSCLHGLRDIPNFL